MGAGRRRYSLVVHDWGAIGLLPALAHPERVERIVVFNSVPFGVSYRWHYVARLFWQRRPAGEVMNALARGPAVSLLVRQARPGLKAMPQDFRKRINGRERRPLAVDRPPRVDRPGGRVPLLKSA